MRKIIMLMGPTASGKTDLVLALYDKKPIEIISVDSALVYVDMNVGTAKPLAEILRRYPHKLVDIISPEQKYSVYDFINDAVLHIKNAIKNNKIPVLVGGTSFYFHALEYGLSNLPKSTEESRAYVAKLIDDVGVYGAYKKLSQIDNTTAKKIHSNDKQRISRALQVYYLTKTPLSFIQGNKKQYFKNYSFVKFACMLDKEKLNKRIENRVHKMMEDGFIDEVAYLRQNYQLNSDNSSMKAVGYKQVWQYLDGNITKEQMVKNIITDTKKLAKKQRTWIRSMDNINLLAENKAANLLKLQRI